MESITVTQLSSLEKVFPDDDVKGGGYREASALRGELFSYQIVLKKGGWGLKEFSCRLESSLPGLVRMYRVETVPCGLAAYPAEDRRDGDYLSYRGGLFPDLLRPFEGKLTLSAFQNTVLWIDAIVSPDCPAGAYPLRFIVEGTDAEIQFTLRVVPASLPGQRLLFTQWFHVDCLADQYRVPVYSEEHWKLIEAYLREAAAHGMNTVLTPALTPPLDTAVGRERPCVQLVEIEKAGGTYRFNFSRLSRFVELARSCGITHFEIAHLFTQWGAAFAPNIYVTENGERRRAFGWDTPADSSEYAAFLKQFLPALIGFFERAGLRDKLLFHISDEPGEQHLETYRKNVELVRSLIGDLPVIDALSSLDFYDSGLVRHPVVATDHIDPFLEREVPGLWAYYCCSQGRDVGNRFLAMPSPRNRVLGLQLYKFHIAGFLHWGYNFWYSQESREKIDPFRVTDGGGAFPGGDPFSVYPGENGAPLPSLRLKVFFHGLQDLRALELLESLAGREAVERCVPGFSSITFSQYSRDPPYLLGVRERVNQEIKLLNERE